MASKNMSVLVCLCLLVFYTDLVKGINMTNHEEFSKLIEAKRLTQNRHSKQIMSNEDGKVLHFAGWATDEGSWKGGRARITTWDISNVAQNASSTAQISAYSFDGEETSIIEAGFHVNHELYNNNDLHFYTFWTADSRKTTGCYNTQCPGFVVNNGTAPFPGQGVDPPSIYGEKERYMIINIKKDSETGDWSLYREDGGEVVLLGWWPKTLFTGKTLADSATKVHFVGTVYFPKHDRSPPMGSGHLADEGDNKAASFKRLTVYNYQGVGFNPVYGLIYPFIDDTACYSVSDLKEVNGEHGFFYGGPGTCVE